MEDTLRLGLDVGSTTVKAVVLNGEEIIFSDYRRHNADVRGEMRQLLLDVEKTFPSHDFRVAITGSGGLGVAQQMGVQFIQEVIASTAAIEKHHPKADVVIELGGEDAKIIYLHPVPEQRMNGTCAGGTGAFIDQMATLLKTDATGMNELAAQYDHLYPIASRCGVFAKTDVQPLLNQGAAHTDIAASVFQAVATQTIAGLACGHPIRGRVIFLGGPLHFLPELRQAYVRALGDNVDEFITPAQAQLYVAMGAAMRAEGPALSLPHLARELAKANNAPVTNRMRPLFANDAEKAEFDERHRRDGIEQGTLEGTSGPLYLGIDAGSTTIKSVVLDDQDRIVFSTYGSNEGDPVAAAVQIARQIRAALPDGAWIGRACTTGYGEALVKTALHADEGIVETMAHFRGAQKVCPEVTSVIDIGGQDMKFLKIRNGVVDSIAVNEACSSGCGSFLQTFAETMNTDVINFAQEGVRASAPVDLGSRCTVFMNSSVKQAQKEGADIGDISAGLSYSVVRNALYKVIKVRDNGELGDHVVVEGGTFLNDAVLRAFELLTGINVIRPNIAGLMGAFGAALVAKSHCEPGAVSALMQRDLDGFTVTSEQRTCRLCQNNCKLTITSFDDDSRHVSGNRCERGASLDRKPQKSSIPNLYDYKYRRVFDHYRSQIDRNPRRGEIGIPRALGIYEDYPLWFTILTRLGFQVTLSGRSNHDLFEAGMESIPSENVCYPAKLAHGHVEWLLDRGVKTIFFPCVNYERQQFSDADNNYNCPIVAYYPQVLEKNIDRLREPGVRFLDPFVNLNEPDHLARRLTEIFADWDVTAAEAREAVAAGYAELAQVRKDIKAEGDRALQYMRENNMRGIVLAGRPYHIDPEINHGIPETVVQLGMVVFSEDALSGDEPVTHLERPLRVMDQWAYHSRLYEAAAQVATRSDLNLVQLNSFGCGLDAVTTDQVQEILEGANDVFTVLKIDEVSNLGAATIRLRSLQAATAERAPSMDIDTTDPNWKVPAVPRAVFGPEEKKKHTLFIPQMAPMHFRMLEAVFERAGFNVQLLAHASKADVECGLKFVNNDACYPAIMAIGQLVNAFIDGGADPDNSTVAMSQTGGMCRATNYAAMLRKALKDAGYPQVPVLALSAQGLETNPGFKLTLPMVHQLAQATTLGDLFQNVLLRVRPYERDEGSANALYEHWDTIVGEFFRFGGYSPTLGRRVGYRWLCGQIVKAFDELPLLDVPRKPRVGVVGEILVKFHPDANNDVVGVIEAEGCEAVVPGLTGFFTQSMATAEWREDHLGVGSRKSTRRKELGIWLLNQYAKPANDALARTNGKFTIPEDIRVTRDRASQVISVGTQAGEGWFLVGEMMELIESGAPNIVCAQPFACLPNHVVGRGMFKDLRRIYPEANITSIDYDPGASEVNQLNRIKLMVATAFKNSGGDGKLHWLDSDEEQLVEASL